MIRHVDADGFARLLLVLDVQVRRRIVPHQDSREPGFDSGAGEQLRRLLRDLIAHSLGEDLTINQVCRHAASICQV